MHTRGPRGPSGFLVGGDLTGLVLGTKSCWPFSTWMMCAFPFSVDDNASAEPEGFVNSLFQLRLCFSGVKPAVQHPAIGQWVQFPVATSYFLSLFPGAILPKGSWSLSHSSSPRIYCPPSPVLAGLSVSLNFPPSRRTTGLASLDLSFRHCIVFTDQTIG